MSIHKNKMRAFGIPRTKDVVQPDMIDGRVYATKSSSMHCRGKGGDFRSTFKSSQVKRNARRVWKKLERSRAKREYLKDLNVLILGSRF